MLAATHKDLSPPTQMPACNPLSSSTTHICMQCANNTSATCMCHYYEPQSPETISRSGFWDRHTAINAYSGHLPGRFCPTERGPRLAPRKKAFLVAIVGYRGGGEKPGADSMHKFDFFNTCLFLIPKSLVNKRAFKGHTHWSQSRLHFYPKQLMWQEPPKVPAMLTHT